MSGEQVIQNGEKVLPIFFKKKVLSLKRTKDLEEMVKCLKKENDQTIANEKVMLDKIRLKDNEFVKRLESHLEFFKATNVREIVLTDDMLPALSPRKNASSECSDPPELEDSLKSLVEWYSAMATYVSSQRDQVCEIISDWFSQMDRIASEGESDPQSATESKDYSVDPGKSSSENNTVWYMFLILFCFMHVFIFYMPEDFDQCADDFVTCFSQSMAKLPTFLFSQYLRFHNITLDYQAMDSEIHYIG